MRLGDLIKRLRKDANLSQGALGRACGLSQTTISDLERGRNEGSTELPAIAKAFGLTAEAMLSMLNGGTIEARTSNVLPLPQRQRQKVMLLTKLAETISDIGLAELIGAAKQLAKTNPYVVKTKRSR